MSPSPERRPRGGPILIVCVAVGLIVLIGLGTWQLDRRAWKQDMLARVAASVSAEPVDLPAAIEDAASWEYRAVRLSGTWDHDRERVMVARVRNGAVGAHLFTPLVRDGDTVLVNRGWVPLEAIDPAGRPGSRQDGPVTVTGLVRLPVAPGWFTPENDPVANEWYWVSIPDMVGDGRVAPVFVAASAEDPAPDALPVPAPPQINIPDNHLSYAFTWYGLAVTLAVIALVFRYRTST